MPSNDSSRAETSADPAGPGQREIGRLVATAIQRCIVEGDRAVAEFCAAHPEHSEEIREVLSQLAEAGLLGNGASIAAVPETLGEFRLIRKIGEGGMGLVFLAEQTSLSREVAIKLIRPEHLYSKRARERFRREVESIARLNHPNLVPIYTVGEADGLPYFAMERIEGHSVAQVVSRLRESSQPEETLDGVDLLGEVGLQGKEDERVVPEFFRGSYETVCLRVVEQVAEALHHAHLRGVIHRDIKPSNLMVTPAGRVVILDFGLANLCDEVADGNSALTRTGAQPGSLCYMSPEQLNATPDARSPQVDVYSLGVTLYEMLSLCPAFDESTPERNMRAILEGRVVPLRQRNPRIQRDVATICQTAIEPDLRRRYASAAALASDLANVLAGRPIAATPPSFVDQVVKLISRHRAVSAIAFLLVAVLIGFSIAMAGLTSEARAEARGAVRAADRAGRVSDFLVDLVSGLSPDETRNSPPGHALLTSDMLRRYEPLIAKRFPNEPQTQAALLGAFADLYLKILLYDRAVALRRKALVVLESDKETVPIELTICRRKLAGGLSRLRDFAPAEEQARRALAESRAIEPNGIAEIESTLVLAGVLRQKGDWGEAAELLRAGRQLVDETAGDETAGDETADDETADDETADDRTQLTVRFLVAESQLLSRQGSHSGAAELQRRILELQRAKHGNKSLVVSSALATLADTIGRSDPRRGEAMLREAMDVVKRVSAEPHPAQLASILRRLVVLYQRLGDHAAAEKASLEELALLRGHLGDGHLVLVHPYSALAQIKMAHGEFEKAESFYEQVLRIQRAYQGDTSRDVATTKFRMASLRLRQADFPAAEKLHREVLNARLALLDADSQPVVESLYVLATVRRSHGDLASAREYYLRVYEIQRRQLAEFSPNLWGTVLMLAESAAAIGDGSALLELRGQAETLRRHAETLRKDHPHRSGVLFLTGVILSGEQKLAAARAALEGALHIRREVLGQSHSMTAWLQATLARCLSELGEKAEAETMFLRCLPILIERYGLGHFRVREPITSLVSLFEANGRSADAASWRAKLALPR